MPGNADADTDAGNTDANANAGNTATDAYGDTDTYNYAYSDTIGDPASADAKATAHAVPSADAVSEWVKKLKELKSNRELARQLASSLLFGRHYSLAFWSAAVLRRSYGNILNSKIVVFQRSADHSDPMPKPNMSWPHAPKHQLLQSGTYFVTAGTYLKDTFFALRSVRRFCSAVFSQSLQSTRAIRARHAVALA